MKSFNHRSLTALKALKYLDLAIDYFGYGGLDAQFVKDKSLDVEAIGQSRGWLVDIGVLTVTFSKNPLTKISWDDKFTKKDLKRAVAELKKKKTR